MIHRIIQSAGADQLELIGIADAADRGVDTRLGQPLGVSDRQVSGASITMMDQLVSLGRRPLADGAGLRASRTKPVAIEVETRQPTIFRAKTSMTKGEGLSATGSRTGPNDTMPCQLET